ncbi:TonB-dependent receptor [Aquabacterium sp. OR-4]|uniref:TonB-dependent receptor n=1 Tax=Aquabacterium sp. OR-4 TaxID=2978127 RepID=UPI0028C73488|nr:TonB-dependent receptor [Aquabacterium sp. OR-4]MDT7835929.1 TonB-dependent receptor [Aquabacterium sp. OR-4]
MKTRQHLALSLLAAAALSLLGLPAQAQLSSATLKGQVHTASGAPAKGGLLVLAINRDTGSTYRSSTRNDGGYTLVGLAPGAYSIRISADGASVASEVILLQVGETASLDLALGANQQVIISGTVQRKDVRTSEVGTNVSRKIIEALPQVTRNFLSAADLAPGVRFETDAGGNTRLRGGAQNQDAVNVYIDGMGQKNNILRGGLAGQDTSEGNPFPQSAIAEYKVLTQNYKAELEQVSSAAITAITKSGTNTLQGEAYVNRLGSSSRAYSPVEREAEANGTPRPSFTQMEYGFNLGGALQPNTLHYLLAYDGKTIDRPKQIVGRNFDKFAGNPGLVAALAAQRGGFVQKFDEHLLFGKLNANLSDEQRLEFSFKFRQEDSYKLESDIATARSALNNNNDETRLDLKHEWARGDWLNEARVAWESARWNPQSDAADPLVRYKYSPTTEIRNIQDLMTDGGSPNAQDRKQSGLTLKNDLTYTGLRGHVLKGGAQWKAMDYALGGTAFRVDAVDVVVDNTTGLPYYNGNTCTGSNIASNGLSSDQCRITRAIPPVAADFRNNQFGLYLQDDWTVSRQLELNLGLRWDYEDNMLNNDYVTPADRVAALRGLDGRTVAGITAPAGQTYAQSLAKGGVNIDDYIATGSSRKSFKGALAPRLGASFDLSGNKATVLFGGWGRSYDRTMANHALDELQKNKQTGGEIWLVRNELKMPYADQMSIGLRQAVMAWNLEFTLSDIHAKNQFVWSGGNRDPNGGYGTQSPIDPLWGGPNGFGTLILGDTVGENRAKSLFVKADKPYTLDSGWSASVAYTYTDARTTHKEWDDNIFDWTHGRSTHGWNPSKLTERHRVVAAGVADGLLPWGVQVSGKLTYGSGLPRRVTSCAAGWNQCVYVKADGDRFSQVDLGLSKDLVLGPGRLRLRVDVLNLFNTDNWGYYDDWGGGPGNPQNAYGGDNANVGKRTGLRGDMRTVKLTLGYAF